MSRKEYMQLVVETKQKELDKTTIDATNPLDGPSLDESLWEIEKKETEKDTKSEEAVIEPEDLRITTENELIANTEKQNDEPNESENAKSENAEKEVEGIF